MVVTFSSCPPGSAELTQVYALVKMGAQLGSYKRKSFPELDPVKLLSCRIHNPRILIALDGQKTEASL